MWRGESNYPNYMMLESTRYKSSHGEYWYQVVRITKKLLAHGRSFAMLRSACFWLFCSLRYEFLVTWIFNDTPRLKIALCTTYKASVPVPWYQHTIPQGKN
jgi:hypothetical protein